MKSVVRRALGEVRDIDEIYRRLPTGRYHTDELERYLEGA